MASAMRFWGIEAKANKPLQVSLEYGFIIHVSQVTLSDIMTDDETVTVHVKVGNQSLVLGMLSQNSPQLSFNMFFNKDFEISHNWKNGSIHLMGYQTETGELEPESESSDEDEDAPILIENGQAAAPAAKASIGKPKVDNKSKPEENDESDEDESSEEVCGEDDDVDSDEEMGMSDSDGDEEDSDDDEDESPVKAVAGKKRPNADAKTPLSKKAKITTPQKTVVKKGDKTPKSGGSKMACCPCKRRFKSEADSQAHSKDKHGAK